MFVAGYRPDLIAAEKHPPSDPSRVCSASISPGGRGRSLDTPRSRSFHSCPRHHLFDSFASWHGVNRAKQMNEATASRVGYGIVPARRKPLTHYFLSFLIQIFLGNIILRYLMSANFPLLSAPCVFYARHYVGFERVSFLEQLVDTLRIRTLDVGQSL